MRRIMRAAAGTVIFLLSNSTVAAAQDAVLVSGEGWQGFAEVSYVGGDATQTKKTTGILILTDSTLAFYTCDWACVDDVKKSKFFAKKPLSVVLLNTITELRSSTQVSGAGFTEKLAIGLLASDHDDEYFRFVYETASNAEAPMYKTPKSLAGTIEAKVRFRLKKLGISLVAQKAP